MHFLYFFIIIIIKVVNTVVASRIQSYRAYEQNNNELNIIINEYVNGGFIYKISVTMP